MHPVHANALREPGRGQPQSGPGHRSLLLLGTAAGICLALASMELYLRLFPPSFIEKYLGEACPLAGPFAADDALPYKFRSVETLLSVPGVNRQEILGLVEASRVAREPASVPSAKGHDRPWVILGNSFAVEHEGSYSWRLRRMFPKQPMFNLAAVGHGWYWHLAQLKTLLEAGCCPSRCFVTVVPVDLLDIGQQDIDSHFVTSKGALTIKPKLPPAPFGSVVANVRLALAAWVRADRQMPYPGFDMGHVHESKERHPAGFVRDTERVIREIGRLSVRHHFKVTFVLIPSYRQIVQGAKFSPQDLFIRCADEFGLGYVDPRAAFQSSPDAQHLYLVRHLSAEGDRLVAEALREQIIRTGN